MSRRPLPPCSTGCWICLGQLQAMLRQVNPWVQDFIMAAEILAREVEHRQLIISVAARPAGQHARRYNAAEGLREVAVLMGEEPGQHDLVLRRRADGGNGVLQTIDESHRACDPLHFVLLSPLGTTGWHPAIAQAPQPGRERQRMVTTLQFYAYRLQIRPHQDDSLHRAGRLFQEFVCMAYAKVEAIRLKYISTHQREIRADLYQSLIFFQPGEERQAVAGEPRHTQLTAWMTYNRASAGEDPECLRVLYPDFPQKYRWDAGQKRWHRRRNMQAAPTIGRVQWEKTSPAVHPELPPETVTGLVLLRISDSLQRAGKTLEDFGLPPLGNGELPTDAEGRVTLPPALVLEAELPAVIDWTFGNLTDADSMASRAVLAPTNSTVDSVNSYVTDIFPGQARVDRPGGRGYGGVAIATRDGLSTAAYRPATPRPQDSRLEAVWSTVTLDRGRRLLIGSIYRPPRYTAAALDADFGDLEAQLQRALLDHPNVTIIIGGDLNSAVAILCDLLRVTPARLRVAALAGLAISRELGADVGPTEK
ncbi:hypothetical protein FJT64_008988 [Amphibalanus amphitrite]|uniref:Helitron helicase-like domain-containing protein n=1 Tax=Amphibalanus amphitrite TaxID=1232801 RepID=A0A6A4VSW0_AMPAM|nr:hypothetical protein FJT64_008988 [Amphibalanus amphitrite]